MENNEDKLIDEQINKIINDDSSNNFSNNEINNISHTDINTVSDDINNSNDLGSIIPIISFGFIPLFLK